MRNYNGVPSLVEGFVRGPSIAHGRMSASVRALTAVDLVSGRLQLTEPTVTQSARLCRVSASYVHKMALAAEDPEARAKLERGWSLTAVIGLSPKSVARLANGANGANGATEASLLDQVIELLGQMSPEERAGLAHRIGPSVLWDEYLAPAIR